MRIASGYSRAQNQEVMLQQGAQERGPSVGFALRAAAFAGIWLIFAEGELASLIVGLPAIAAALWAASVWKEKGKGGRIRIRRAGGFVAFFLRESLRGGVDVAKRTVTRPPRLSCGWLDYEIALPAGVARVFFANVVGLLPGTLAADLEEDVVIVHVLDDTRDTAAELRKVEHEVARLFGIALED